jgi:hypothetical protein
VLVLAVAAAFAFGVAATTTLAATPDGQPAPASLALGPAAPDVSRFDNAIDAQEMEEVVDLVERLDPHLYVGEDGLVHLRDVSAAELGVSEEFLANFKSAMTFSNALIERGAVVVAPDMTVTTASPVKTTLGGLNPAPPSGAVTDAGAPNAAVPEWGAWNYHSGSMYYNSYNTYYQYRNRYYTLCNSMAAYQGYPWMSSSLMNFYGYNQSYFNNYCYNPGGTYYYLPYQNSCSYNYNPCYGGSTASYKPAYYWVRSYSYSNSCRCYNYNYNWQGYWCRY